MAQVDDAAIWEWSNYKVLCHSGGDPLLAGRRGNLGGGISIKSSVILEETRLWRDDEESQGGEEKDWIPIFIGMT